MLTRRTLLAALPLLAAAAPRALALQLQLDGAFSQGGLVTGRVAPGSKVTLDGAAIRVGAAGLFLIGFGRDAPAGALLKIRALGGAEEVRRLAVAQRTYEVQRIDGLPPNTVEPSRAELDRIAAEQKRINAARARDTDESFFADGFVWPAVGPISGVYGSQRILNGEPRRPHFGVDVAAPVGAPIRAPAGGIASLADPDLFFTGGTVMLDHGYGLASIFAHMRAVTAREGDRLKQGDAIGELGGTGRATGPHLHWGMYLFKTPLDPQFVVGPMPA